MHLLELFSENLTAFKKNKTYFTTCKMRPVLHENMATFCDTLNFHGCFVFVIHILVSWDEFHDGLRALCFLSTSGSWSRFLARSWYGGETLLLLGIQHIITIKQSEAYVITKRQKNLSTALLLGLHESVNLKNTFLLEISKF